ncbi:MAG: HAMP domain-containing sensor histidine kinase [Actinomycetaceae bacterium]|nr:HAMP domain-containing sensor histidine kinase [Actinomycetaceae bacterium]
MLLLRLLPPSIAPSSKAIHRRLLGPLAKGRYRKPRSQEPEHVHLLSHEIRTPLSLIKGATELLADESPGPLTAAQKQFLTTIKQNADFAISMAENFLLDARLQSAALRLNLTSFDLRVLTRDTARQLREVNGTPLVVTDPGDPLILEADQDLIRQVLWNLINNACRHSNHQHVEVRTYRREDNVVIEIADYGSGITPEQRKVLFTPFSQFPDKPTTPPHSVPTASTPHLSPAAVDSSKISKPATPIPPKAPPTGVGLGMGIVRTIAQMHGGRVVVDSISGHGTVMHVVLPCEQPQATTGWRGKLAWVRKTL